MGVAWQGDPEKLHWGEEMVGDPEGGGMIEPRKMGRAQKVSAAAARQTVDLEMYRREDRKRSEGVLNRTNHISIINMKSVHVPAATGG